MVADDDDGSLLLYCFVADEGRVGCAVAAAATTMLLLFTTTLVFGVIDVLTPF